MTADDQRPAILVLAPMPAAPTSAGNRRRLMATCEAVSRGGFAIDFAYLQHEDQIYRRFGQHPPTDTSAMAAIFRQTFLIPAAKRIPLKTWSAAGFPIDAWCPDEAVDFVTWYFAAHPNTCAIVVNYVFLSRCLDAVPEGVLRVIDTHDRFADRQLQYRPFRSEPNFFYTDRASEAAGLSRADVVLAIQAAEADYFRELVERKVYLLPPRFVERRKFRAPKQIETFGFIGHGNDANLFSIGKFAHAWAAAWQPDLPILVIAGEICSSLRGLDLPGMRLAGYVEDVATFYDGIDAVVAPMLMGSGLKMKVAEALSMGRPVFGTAIAFEGFETDFAAHRLRGVSDTIATVLRLWRDAAGLEALTAACADLLDRYHETAAACEAEWIAAIPRRPGGVTLARVEALPEAPQRFDLGGVSLVQERSLRSLPIEDEEGGILVATETPSPAVARAAGYAPERRRWFAKTVSAAMTSPSGSSLSPDLRGASIAFSPEWIHARTLPQPARAMLAACFSTTCPDWAADARLIGQAPEEIVIVAFVPSFLLSRHRPSAAFALGASGSVREARLAHVTALVRSPDLAFTAQRDDLTPVPAVLTLVPVDAGAPTPTERAASAAWPPVPETLLLLHDDLIGHLRLVSPFTNPLDA